MCCWESKVVNPARAGSHVRAGFARVSKPVSASLLASALLFAIALGTESAALAQPQADRVTIGWDASRLELRSARPELSRRAPRRPDRPRSSSAPQQVAPGVASLASGWQGERAIDFPPALLTHEMVASRVTSFAKQSPELFTAEEIGRSVEGRSISRISFGRGPFQVLLWSQMHGDEPTATAALLDILEHVRRHRDEPAVRRMLSAMTVHFVPMLNPDGAERFQRRNAQGIDINRDALLLQAPEGRALKALRDRFEPALGFNLHNQNWKTSAGKGGKPASISLLAVAFDAARTETPGRVLAKKTCAVLRDTLEAFIPGQIARYDDEFEVRAFGDNVTKWGTPVVLIETGPYQGSSADQDLQKFNFVAILTALEALADGRAMQADPARYESLPMNESDVFSLLVRNATIVPGNGVPAFTGDVGLASTRQVRQAVEPPGGRQLIQAFRVDDLGDLRVFGAVETVDATGLFLAPSGGWKEGATVNMADWTAFKTERTLTVGGAPELALLRPTGPGTYRVVRLIPPERVLGSVGPSSTVTPGRD